MRSLRRCEEATAARAPEGARKSGAGKHNTGIAKYIEIADALDVPFNSLINF